MYHTATDSSGDNESGSSKQVPCPFLVDIDCKWAKLAKELKDLNKCKNFLIEINCELIKLLWKMEDSFCKNQNHMDSKGKKKGKCVHSKSSR